MTSVATPSRPPVRPSKIVYVNNDNRPHLEISISGKKYLGLLDSGAQSTVFGIKYKEIAEGFQTSKSNIVIRTADGTAHSNTLSLKLPISFNGETKSLKVLYVPSIRHSLILGMDFWDLFKIRAVDCATVESEKAINISDSHELSPSEAETLQQVLKKMPFSKDGILSKTTLIKHSIDTGDAAPIKQIQYALSPYVQKDVYLEIDRLLQIGAIVPCKMSAWNNPMIAVRKPSGKIRLCIDARKLNSVTKKDAYPQQQINRILSRLTGTKILSSIDFSDAYHQVELEEKSRQKTAFAISGKGYYAYQRMPFGLCNSGATLCRLVDSVIGCDLEPHVFVYLDDIIIATNSFKKF